MSAVDLNKEVSHYNERTDNIWLAVTMIYYAILLYGLSYFVTRYSDVLLGSVLFNTALIAGIVIVVVATPILYAHYSDKISIYQLYLSKNMGEFSRFRRYFLSRYTLIPLLATALILFIVIPLIGFVSMHPI